MQCPWSSSKQARSDARTVIATSERESSLRSALRTAGAALGRVRFAAGLAKPPDVGAELIRETLQEAERRGRRSVLDALEVRGLHTTRLRQLRLRCSAVLA